MKLIIIVLLLLTIVGWGIVFTRPREVVAPEAGQELTERQVVENELVEQGVEISEQSQLTRKRLDELLREAERGHAVFERELGRPDPDWPVWYANFIVNELEREGIINN